MDGFLPWLASLTEFESTGPLKCGKCRRAAVLYWRFSSRCLSYTSFLKAAILSLQVSFASRTSGSISNHCHSSFGSPGGGGGFGQQNSSRVSGPQQGRDQRGRWQRDEEKKQGPEKKKPQTGSKVSADRRWAGLVAAELCCCRCSWSHPGVFVSGNVRMFTLTSGGKFSRRHIVITCRDLFLDGVWGYISSDSCVSLLFIVFISSFHSYSTTYSDCVSSSSSLAFNLKADWRSQRTWGL